MGEVLEVGVFPEVGEVSQTEVGEVSQTEVVLRWGRFLRPKRPKKRNSKSTRRTVREKTYRNATHYLGNPFLIGFYLYH